MDGPLAVDRSDDLTTYFNIAQTVGRVVASLFCLLMAHWKVEAAPVRLLLGAVSIGFSIMCLITALAVNSSNLIAVVLCFGLCYGCAYC